MVAGGLKKRGFGWFNKLGFINSYQTALNRNKDMGKDFNKKAIEWKEALEKEHHDMKSAGLDPKSKEDVKGYQEIHGQPATYQVNIKISSYRKSTK